MDRLVAEFIGAQPPTAVEQFLDSLLPSEADGLVAARRRGVAAASERARADARRCRGAAGPDPAQPGRDRRGPSVLARVPGSFAADGLTRGSDSSRSGRALRPADGARSQRGVRRPRRRGQSARSTCCSRRSPTPTEPATTSVASWSRRARRAGRGSSARPRARRRLASRSVLTSGRGRRRSTIAPIETGPALASALAKQRFSANDFASIWVSGEPKWRAAKA